MSALISHKGAFCLEFCQNQKSGAPLRRGPIFDKNKIVRPPISGKMSGLINAISATPNYGFRQAHFRILSATFFVCALGQIGRTSASMLVIQENWIARSFGWATGGAYTNDLRRTPCGVVLRRADDANGSRPP